MNVRLKKTFGWFSGVVYNDQFLINHYTAQLEMLTATEDPVQQNLAYERLRFWFNEILDGAIFVDEAQANIKQWKDTGARVMALPVEPVDQIVGIMLCSKLNAVMEDRMVITDVEIWSRAGDSMSYLHNWKESTGPLAQSGWWQDPRPVWVTVRANVTDKVVNLDRVAEWKDHDLDWNDEKSPNTNTVVFGRFEEDENK